MSGRPARDPRALTGAASRLTPRVGAVLSADVAVPEHERELRFYARVLTTGEQPLWRDDLMNSAGLPVIGLGAQSDAYACLPLQWMPHVQVADVAASVERALAHGGHVLLRDESGAAGWAVLSDPKGAAFGLIPLLSAGDVSPMRDAAAEGAPLGLIHGVTLAVDDAAATTAFYRQVLGRDALGDLRVVPKDDADAEPPVWILHLPVGDLALSLERAREAGGAVLQVTRSASGQPQDAVLRDPVGCRFGLVQG